MQNTNNGLVVYKASAGSGKTYTLTLEYLKQVLSGDIGNFRRLLAVTFTNKATEEMKARIIESLHALSEGKAEQISQTLQKELNLDAISLQKKAKKVSSAILHDYSRFTISTIDSFFQKIIQAFVKEVGLRPGYKLELNQDSLLEEAIDLLMLNIYEKPATYDWIFKIIEDRMETGGAWDIRYALKNKASLIFKEDFRGFGNNLFDKIHDSEYMKNYSLSVKKVVEVFNEKMQGIANQAFSLLEESSLEVSNFRFGYKGPFGYFVNIRRGNFEPSERVLEANLDINKWIRSREEGLTRLGMEQIVPNLSVLLRTAIELYEENKEEITTASIVLKNLNILAILGDIDANIKLIAQGENIMPISETTMLLSKLIDGSDSPFIYEKIGSYYKTFMIDEFQDTSQAQWDNFRPLIGNSLAEGNFNMLVGDVKQSIYRWRNGDWKILAYGLENDFSGFGLNTKVLETNWRSAPNIVKFNNGLFSKLASYISYIWKHENNGAYENLITDAYKEVKQNVAENKEENTGYVNISAYYNDEESKSKEKIIENFPHLIEDIQKRGYNANDIAVLVRSAAHGQVISDCLLKYKKENPNSEYCFDVISQDTLFIRNSLEVQLIIALLKACIEPDDEVNNAFINYYLASNNDFVQQKAILDPKGNYVLDLFSTTNNESESIFHTKLSENISNFLNGITQLSLPEIFEELISYFKLNRNNSAVPFLQELHDEILRFSKGVISDISFFLDWWESEGNTTKLSPANSKGINIITIHKSKGLQYPVVLMPFCEWSMKPRTNGLMWVSPKQEPFNKIPFIPVSYTKALDNSYFKNDYLLETVQTLVDNINLMYVAFTRAEEELYLMLPLGKQDRDIDRKNYINNTAECLFNFFNFAKKTEIDLGEIKGYINDSCLEFGKPNLKEKHEIVNNSILLENYHSNPFTKKLRIHYDSQTYMPSSIEQLEQRNYGKLMHYVFSKIITFHDVNSVTNELVESGVIQKDELPLLINKIKESIYTDQIKEWFSDKWKVYTERYILLPDGGQTISRKPDRVMFGDNETIVIDYKFGEIYSIYNKQIGQYADLLRAMNYPNVKAYIWYVENKQISEVI